MLHELHAQGVSISAIARQTGLDRKTVRRHLAAGIQCIAYFTESCHPFHVKAATRNAAKLPPPGA